LLCAQVRLLILTQLPHDALMCVHVCVQALLLALTQLSCDDLMCAPALLLALTQFHVMACVLCPGSATHPPSCGGPCSPLGAA
jgi:hypothetical protein